MPSAKLRESVDAAVAFYRALAPATDPLHPCDAPPGAPIFVVRMRRSGTTPLDRIISSHATLESG